MVTLLEKTLGKLNMESSALCALLHHFRHHMYYSPRVSSFHWPLAEILHRRAQQGSPQDSWYLSQH